LSDIISGAKTSHPNQDELLKDTRGRWCRGIWE